MVLTRIPPPEPGFFLWGGWCDGCQVRAARFSAPVRSSAARAALRGETRSYACFGPIRPVGFARERLGAPLDIASYKQGGRARLAQKGDRAPPARRFAGKPAPTLVSGQLGLWDLRANALAHASISRRTNKAVARAWHRTDWPETNVGAGLPAKRRAGGARSHRR